MNGVRKRSLHVLGIYSVALITVFVLPYALSGAWSFSICIAAVLAPILALYDINGGMLRGLSQPVRSQIPLLLVRPLVILIMALPIWLSGILQLNIALFLQVIGSALVLLLSFFYLRRALPRGVARASPIYNDRDWRKAYPVFLMITGMNFLNIEMGILLLGFLNDPEGSSGMRVSQSAGQLVVLPLMAVNMVIQPRLAIQTKDRDALLQSYAQGGRLGLIGALVLGVPMIIFAGPLVRLAFGEAYVSLATHATQILIIGQIVNAAVGSTGVLLAMSGQEKLAMRAQVCALVVTIGTAFALAPAFSATGVAIGIALGLIVKNAIEAWYLRRIYGRWLTAFMRMS